MLCHYFWHGLLYFLVNPISAELIRKSKLEVAYDRWLLRKCPAHVVISGLFCTTILHHFWEAPSCFLRSVMVLSEDITVNHRLKGLVRLVTFCLSAAPNIMPAHPAHWWKTSLLCTPSWGQEPPSPPPSAASFSDKTVKKTKCFFRDPTSLFESLYRQLSDVTLLSLWLGGQGDSALSSLFLALV